MHRFVQCQDTLGNCVPQHDSVVQCPRPAQAGQHFVLDTSQLNTSQVTLSDPKTILCMLQHQPNLVTLLKMQELQECLCARLYADMAHVSSGKDPVKVQVTQQNGIVSEDANACRHSTNGRDAVAAAEDRLVAC